MNHRHLKLSIIVLVQYMYTIPKSVRSQIISVITFKSANNEDLDILNKAFLMMKKDDFRKLVYMVYNTRYNFLFVNRLDNSIYNLLKN